MKNYLHIKKLSAEQSIRSADQRTIYRSNKYVPIEGGIPSGVQRTVCRLKNYLQVEVQSADGRTFFR